MSDSDKFQSSHGEAAQPVRSPERARDRGRRRRGSSPARIHERLLNLDEIKDLIDLVTVHGLTEFELEREGIRVRLRRDAGNPDLANPPVPPPGTHPASHFQSKLQTPSGTLAELQEPPVPPGITPEDENLHIITSPIVGTFYRSPSPTAENFVKIGSQVNSDTVVCIIEAMKLMNEIQAETSGEVVKIYVENGQPVEYGQPLFGIKG